MFIALIISTILSLSGANPFHKYPYVFLLDVGNEDLEKTNTEQLRLSIPGGSLAMKYPVLDEGDTISHVRVSGIDFGTDLKVNIVGGGPGYKYVLLVFMGNPGVSYDAVVTLQTLPNDMNEDTVNESQIVNTKLKVSDDNYEVSDTDSDENSNDSSITMNKYKEKSKSEVMQSSSTFYNYANGDIANGGNDEESEDTSAEEEDDDDNISNEKEDSQSSDEDSSEQEDEENDESFKKQINFKEKNNIVIPRSEQYTYNNEKTSNSDYRPADILDDSLYEKYQDLKPHFGEGFKVYPQSTYYNKPYQVNSAYDNEDPVELDQMFNDEEVHNDAKYNDGSNSIDSDYGTAEY